MSKESQPKRQFTPHGESRIKKIPIEKLKFNPDNPRRFNDGQLSQADNGVI